MRQTEIAIGDQCYRVAKINVPQQLEVARRLFTVLGMLALKQDKEDTTQVPQAFCGLASNLPREDLETAIDICLLAVTRQQGPSWAPIRSSTGQLIFEDIDLSSMLLLVWHVIKFNGLIDFFAVPPSSSAVTGASPSLDSLTTTKNS